jgi:hypothetical protein
MLLAPVDELGIRCKPERLLFEFEVLYVGHLWFFFHPRPQRSEDGLVYLLLPAPSYDEAIKNTL